MATDLVYSHSNIRKASSASTKSMVNKLKTVKSSTLTSGALKSPQEDHKKKEQESALQKLFEQAYEQNLSLKVIFNVWKDQQYTYNKYNNVTKKNLNIYKESKKYLALITFYNLYLNFLKTKKQIKGKIIIPSNLSFFIKTEGRLIEHVFPKKEIDVELETKEKGLFIVISNSNLQVLEEKNFDGGALISDLTSTDLPPDHMTMYPEYTQYFLNILKRHNDSLSELDTLISDEEHKSNTKLKNLQQEFLSVFDKMFLALEPLPYESKQAYCSSSILTAFCMHVGPDKLTDLRGFIKDNCFATKEDIRCKETYNTLMGFFISSESTPFASLFQIMESQINTDKNRPQYCSRDQFKKIFVSFLNYYPSQFGDKIFSFINMNSRIDLLPEYLEALKEKYEEDTTNAIINGLLTDVTQQYSSQPEAGKICVSEIKLSETDCYSPEIRVERQNYLNQKRDDMVKNLQYLEQGAPLKTECTFFEAQSKLSTRNFPFITTDTTIYLTPEKQKNTLSNEIVTAQNRITKILANIPRKRTWCQFFSYRGRDPVETYWIKYQDCIDSMRTSLNSNNRSTLKALPDYNNLANQYEQRITKPDSRFRDELTDLFERVSEFISRSSKNDSDRCYEA